MWDRCSTLWVRLLCVERMGARLRPHYTFRLLCSRPRACVHTLLPAPGQCCSRGAQKTCLGGAGDAADDGAGAEERRRPGRRTVSPAALPAGASVSASYRLFVDALHGLLHMPEVLDDATQLSMETGADTLCCALERKYLSGYPCSCMLKLDGVRVLGDRPFPGFPGAGGFPGFPGAPGPGGSPFPAFDTTAKPAGIPWGCDSARPYAQASDLLLCSQQQQLSS